MIIIIKVSQSKNEKKKSLLLKKEKSLTETAKKFPD